MKNNEKKIILYLISIITFIISFLIQNNIIKIILYTITVLLCGFEIIIEGIKNIFKLNFKEDTLMTIAIIAAFILGEFPEACMVIILFKLGEFLEEKAINKSEKNIQEIVKIKQEKANMVMQNGEIQIVESENLKVGDIILIKPGEKVPVDGVVISGQTNLDTSAVTGESTPLEVNINDNILSGSVNISGKIEMKVTKELKDSVVSQIVDLVYEATNNKGKSEKFITKFSKIYTPLIIIFAISFVIITTIIGMLDIKTAINRSLVFLVAACPCSLIISVPLAFISCIGAISKKGMLIKGTKHVENLANANIIAFDKTGTLTTGKMKISQIFSTSEYTKEEILKYIKSIEKFSNHPISTALSEIYINVDLYDVQEYKEIAGKGIYGKIAGKDIIFGNNKLLELYDIVNKEKETNKIYLCIDKRICGYITLEENYDKENVDAINELKNIGIKRNIILTGDNNIQAKKIADIFKINEVYSDLLPSEKQEKIKYLKEKNKIIFVGDGINDSPVLAEADFGISMGHGTEIANVTSDAILMNNKIKTIPISIKIARKTMKIVKVNISFSLIVKIIVLILGAMGIAPIWLAILADTGVTLLTVINSLRIVK